MSFKILARGIHVTDPVTPIKHRVTESYQGEIGSISQNSRNNEIIQF